MFFKFFNMMLALKLKHHVESLYLRYELSAHFKGFDVLLKGTFFDKF